MGSARGRVALLVVLTLGAWAMIVPAASAYIDAGSTSFIFSAIVAVGMAISAWVAMSWGRVRSFFSRRGSAEDEVPATVTNETPDAPVDADRS